MKHRLVKSLNTSAVILVLLVCVAALLAVSGQLTNNWLAIVGAGALLELYGSTKLQLLNRTKHWERVPAKVLERGIVEVWTAGYLRYRPEVSFEARVTGEVVRSTRFSMDVADFEGERADVQAILQQYAPGTEFEAFIDPNHNTLLIACVEVPRVRREHYRNCIIAGGSLVLVALVAGGLLAP